MVSKLRLVEWLSKVSEIKNYKLQNTNYKGGGTPGLLGIPNYNVRNYKEEVPFGQMFTASGGQGLFY